MWQISRRSWIISKKKTLPHSRRWHLVCVCICKLRLCVRGLFSSQTSDWRWGVFIHHSDPSFPRFSSSLLKGTVPPHHPVSWLSVVLLPGTLAGESALISIGQIQKSHSQLKSEVKEMKPIRHNPVGGGFKRELGFLHKKYGGEVK